MRLVIEVEQPGYLLLLDEGPEKIIYCLCPSWFAPDTRIKSGRTYLPQDGTRYGSFIVSGEHGREELLAVITDEPLGLDWMPKDPRTPARVLGVDDIELLLEKLRALDNHRWVALSTFFMITV